MFRPRELVGVRELPPIVLGPVTLSAPLRSVVRLSRCGCAMASTLEAVPPSRSQHRELLIDAWAFVVAQVSIDVLGLRGGVLMGRRFPNTVDVQPCPRAPRETGTTINCLAVSETC